MPPQDPLNPLEPENTELDAIAFNGAETNDKLESLTEIAEANLVQQDRTLEAIRDLEPILESSLIAQDAIKEAITASPSASLENGASITIKGIKGDDGYTPVKGVDYYTPEEQEELIATILPSATPVLGTDYYTSEEREAFAGEILAAATPIKGIDYFDGVDGRDGKDGKDGLDGKDGKDGVGKRGPKGDKGDDGSPDTPEEIIGKISGLLPYSAIKDAPEYRSVASRDYALTELTDVDISSPSSGQILVYRNGVWENESVSASGAVDSVNGIFPDGVGNVELDLSDLPTGFTQGSVIFAGASGVLSQDNANFFWDNSNNRLGIGTTTPTQALSIQGGGSNTYIRINDGAGTDAYLGAAGSAGLALQTVSSSPITFYPGSVEAMRVTAAGNVGIGTGTPGYKLAVNGDVGLLNSSKIYVNAFDTIYSPSAGTTNLASPFAQQVNISSGQSGQFAAFNLVTAEGKIAGFTQYDVANAMGRLLSINTQPGVPIAFSPADTEAVRITTGGNVGIGTTTPIGILSVRTNNTNPVLYLDSNLGGGGNSYSISPFISGVSNGGFQIKDETNNVQRLVISTTGNVGIGTTTPAEKLSVQGNGVFAGTFPYISLSPNAWAFPFYFQSGVNAEANATGDYTAFVNPGGKGFSFNESATPRMVINSGGNVGIGTTSPGYKLDVYGSTHIAGSTAAGSLVIDRAGSIVNRFRMFVGDGTGGYTSDENYISSINTGLHILGGATGTTEVMTVLSSGNVGIGTTNPVAPFTVGGDQSGNAGLEIVPGSGIVEQAYNRTGGVYTSLSYDAALFKWRPSGVEKMMLTDTGRLGIDTTNPNSTLHANGSFARAYRAITAARTLDGTDTVIECTTGTFNVTLPTAVGITGREYVIKNTGGGTITVDTTSAQTIDGAASVNLATNNSVTVVSNNANWIVI